MKKQLLMMIVVLLPACGDSGVVGYDFRFAQGPYGWQAGFADYPLADAASYMLDSDHRALEPPLDSSRAALYIAGTNRSDDLFMFYKREVAVRPSTRYRVRFEVEFASEVPSGCAGVGGAPGEGVTVKAGASLEEPLAILAADGMLRMNIDKSNQSQGGRDALVLGDIANSRSCEEPWQWELKTLAGGSIELTSDATGRVWLLVGTDSGFESRTELYYTRFAADFEPF